MRRLKFAVGLMSLTIVTVLAGLALASTALPLAMGWERVVLTSGSMRPLIDPGDVVIASRVQHPVEPGTVVVFRNPNKPGSLVTHRVVEVLPDGSYRTKGDANAQADVAPVTPDMVVGKGTFLVPAIGLPAVWLQKGQVALAASAVVLSLLVGGISRYGLLAKHDPWAATHRAGPARNAKGRRRASKRRRGRAVSASTGVLVVAGMVAGSTWIAPPPAYGAFTASTQSAQMGFTVAAPNLALYLKTNGTTTPATNLDLTSVPPTRTTLTNYDTRDHLPGLNVAKGSTQQWMAGSSVTLSGAVRLTLWSAMANFNTTQSGGITVSLLDCNVNGNNCTPFSVSSVSSSSWSGGNGSWVAREVYLGTFYNRKTTRLQLRISVNDSSSASMMFAYDTADYPARLTVD
jgi:signal peptidase I